MDTYRTNSSECLDPLPFGGLLFRSVGSGLSLYAYLGFRIDPDTIIRERTSAQALVPDAHAWTSRQPPTFNVVPHLSSGFVLVTESVNSHPELIDRKSAAREPMNRASLRLSQRTGVRVSAKGRTLHDALHDMMKDAFPPVVSIGVFGFEPGHSPLPLCPRRTRCSVHLFEKLSTIRSAYLYINKRMYLLYIYHVHRSRMLNRNWVTGPLL